jgi:hypothetical protein
MTQDKKPRGRPRVAPVTSQMPATTVPASVHDAFVREALNRRVDVAVIVREALFSHLKNRHLIDPSLS